MDSPLKKKKEEKRKENENEMIKSDKRHGYGCSEFV